MCDERIYLTNTILKVFMFHLLNTITLLSVAGGLVFFYRSGMYSEKIVFAQKLVDFVLNCM